MTKPLTIVIPIYDGVTHLDFTGPHQFFCRVPGVRVIVASLGGASITSDGLTFSHLEILENISHCDVLCVPGGAGCTKTFELPGFLETIRRLASVSQFVTSVCTGSLILGAAGLLKGKRAACHWAWRDLLVPFGAIPDDARIVHDGNLITGGGVTAGIDFALSVIEKIAGIEVAQTIQLGLEYAPAPPFSGGRPETTTPQIVANYTQSLASAMVERRADIERFVQKAPSSTNI